MQKLKFKWFQNPGGVVQVPSPTPMADVGNSLTLQAHHPQYLHDANFLRTQVQSFSNVHPWPWFSQSRVGKGGGPYVTTSLCSFSKYIYEPFSALKVFRIETTLSKSVIPRTISGQYLHPLDSYFHFIIFLVLFDIWWASPWLCILSSLLIGISHLSLTVKQHIS